MSKKDLEVQKLICIIYKNFQKILKLFKNEYIDLIKMYIKTVKERLNIYEGKRFSITFKFENLRRLEEMMDVSKVLSGGSVVVNIKYRFLSESKWQIYETMERSINKPWYDMLDLAEIYDEKSEMLIVLLVPNGSEVDHSS